MKYSKFILITLCILFVGSASATSWDGLQPYEINPTTPIIFSPKASTLVLEDPDGSFTVADVLKRQEQFKPASEMGGIDALKHYWILQKISSRLDVDRSYKLDGFWLDINTHLLQPDGTYVTLRPTGLIAGYSELSDIDPTLPSSASAKSRDSLFTLKSGETLTLLSQTRSLSTILPKTLVLRVVDNERFLETRRFGLYLEGGLLGIIFVLAIFGWYSYFWNKDRAGLFYGIWISFALMQVITIPTHDGIHLTEFFFNVDGIRLITGSLSTLFFSIGGYGQLIFYFLFASSFLQIAKFFPKTQKFIYVFVGYCVIHFLTTTLWRHNIPQNIYWMGNAVFPLVLFGLLYKCGLERYRQGMSVAMFWLIASLPYLAFRLIFVTGLMGYPSIFSYLPESGLSYLLQNSNVSQVIGLCSEALIMALAVISRNVWIQKELAKSLDAQKILVEGQNKVLEETVAARTKELEAQHQELDEAHQLVVGSVNYASRLQRGQLPRQIRLDGRFASFATIWEPRDTIGGDLYWISSSQHDGPYVLAVADCTGHGVPGAMLSLLVSNSLERIYANDTMENPVSALASLDHFVRTGLNQDRPDSESDDGCDATVLRIDRRLQHVEYAGAKIDLFHVSTAGVVTRHMAQRVSLGYKDRVPSTEIPEVKVLPYEKGDLFVIVTDGLTDQVGGEAGKPKVSYGYRRLEQLLSAHAGAHSQQVIDALRQDFERWQGTHTRRDDVTAVVFSL
jgi:serine phosphatase RsbU (regulator of sigma subunit)